MTERKRFKHLVRERMRRTGERYAAARRQILQAEPGSSSPRPYPFLHYPGSIPASASLRALLANAGVRAPHTGAPLTEAMVFGIAGGIGAGVFAFHYPKEDFSSFYVAGRHLWQDLAAWADGALARLGLASITREASGAKPAETQLRELLAGGRPAMAWLDAAGLPYRAMPARWSGGAYHVVTVYALDDGSALVGDLADEPIPVPLATLTQARLRIRKFKARLLAVEPPAKPIDLSKAVRAGLAACVDGLTKAKMKNFTLDAFATWADQLHGGGSKDSWARMFPRGKHLFTGLWSIHEFIEHFGTGGGLSRPMFADFLAEAATVLEDPALAGLGERYAELGEAWSGLADAALPDSAPLLRRAKEALDRKSELLHTEGASAAPAIGECWQELESIGVTVGERFPLSEAECDSLLRDLQARVRKLHAGEVEALASVEGWLRR